MDLIYNGIRYINGITYFNMVYGEKTLYELSRVGFDFKFK